MDIQKPSTLEGPQIMFFIEIVQSFRNKPHRYYIYWALTTISYKPTIIDKVETSFYLININYIIKYSCKRTIIFTYIKIDYSLYYIVNNLQIHTFNQYAALFTEAIIQCRNPNSQQQILKFNTYIKQSVFRNRIRLLNKLITKPNVSLTTLKYLQQGQSIIVINIQVRVCSQSNKQIIENWRIILRNRTLRQQILELSLFGQMMYQLLVFMGKLSNLKTFFESELLEIKLQILKQENNSEQISQFFTHKRSFVRKNNRYQIEIQANYHNQHTIQQIFNQIRYLTNKKAQIQNRNTASSQQYELSDFSPFNSQNQVSYQNNGPINQSLAEINMNKSKDNKICDIISVVSDNSYIEHQSFLQVQDMNFQSYLRSNKLLKYSQNDDEYFILEITADQRLYCECQTLLNNLTQIQKQQKPKKIQSKKFIDKFLEPKYLFSPRKMFK